MRFCLKFIVVNSSYYGVISKAAYIVFPLVILDTYFTVIANVLLIKHTDAVVVLPSNLTLQEGAASFVAYLTAYLGLVKQARVRAGCEAWCCVVLETLEGATLMPLLLASSSSRRAGAWRTVRDVIE